MKTIQQIFVRYKAFLWAILAPLGVWGVFVVAALDGAAVGLPMDVVIGGYVAQNHARLLLYVLMGAAGSALGSLVVYGIGHTGGEELLRKRVSPERFERLHAAFAKHPFWSLMFPAMLPPPTPFKLFALSAAVSEMGFVRFLLAIFSGRMVRFVLLGLLTIKFGPDVVRLFGTLFLRHYYWFLGAIVAGLVIWLVMRRKKMNNTIAADAEDAQKSA